MRGDYWLYFNQALNSDWCDYIVNYATENYEPRDAVIGFEDSKFDADYRKSEIRWLNAKTEDAIVKEIWWRMIATFVANGLAVIGAGSIIGIDLIDAVLLAGSLGVIKVAEQLARNFLDDGRLTMEEINQSFSVLDRGPKN